MSREVKCEMWIFILVIFTKYQNVFKKKKTFNLFSIEI